ncbi:M4 family metallopeptidase [Flavobacterium sp. 3HN19-14]|uniref:CUB domain-containing protein n=1 Tax=Flavobacterium sp. 3HN19-14 TaxID=3448133 RepID=UPI003EE037DD
MSNPNLGEQPDTYGGDYWADPNNIDDGDEGGVHTNSGIQNLWFYLLSQGGTGTNDNGYNYNVAGIGITQAAQIAYRNLTTYITPNASYLDAYNGALQAATDLFGNTSSQYAAVQEAWFAVGVGNGPAPFCEGTTYLTTPSGIFVDGSNTSDYNAFSDCKWVIQPEGANQITLYFQEFDTEEGYDYVYVYDGLSDTDPLLGAYSGDNIPASISTSAGVGAMCIKFVSDELIESSGWTIQYTSTGITPTCSSTTLSNASGTFSDGSGSGNYGNNQNCSWYIAPPCATSITLNFSLFATEQTYDTVAVFDASGNSLGVFSATDNSSLNNCRNKRNDCIVQFRLCHYYGRIYSELHLKWWKRMLRNN